MSEVAQQRPKEYYTRRRANRKLRALKYLGNQCVGCGLGVTVDNFPAFDFHHRNPLDKRLTIGTGLNLLRSWDNIVKELNKCDPMCSNCHRILLGKERTGYGYARELYKELKS